MLNNEFSQKLRWGVGIEGLVLLVLGFLILFWPDKTASIIAILIGLSLAFTGSTYLSLMFFRIQDGWARIGHLLLGLLYVIAGFTIFFNLEYSTKVIFWIIGISIGVTWIWEGITSFVIARMSPTPSWTIASGIISLVSGITMLFIPVIGAATLWMFIGSLILIVGIMNIIRYYTWKNV